MKYKNEYRRSIDEFKPIPPPRENLNLYWILANLRIILTLIGQRGYVHPDEFFQSIEVISGNYFDIDVHVPWEFNNTFPLRTILIPQIIVGIPYSILTRLSEYSLYIFGFSLTTPYFLLLFPRLAVCLLSFTTDYCLYKVCCIYGQSYKIRLITLASSYVMIIYATRTFSNSIELILFSLLLYYVSQCMVFSDKVITQGDYLAQRYYNAKDVTDRVKYYKLINLLPPNSLNHCFKIATITVIGIFNRPTFIAFAFPPIFFWLTRGLGSKTVGFKDFHVRIFTFVIYAVPSVLLFILIDSYYYGYLTVGEMIEFEIGMNNFLVTPLNFIKYNTITENLENHGLHPRFLHFLINLPLLYGILGILGLLNFLKICYSAFRGHWLNLPKIHSIVGLMIASFIVPVILLSIFPHQEPRFIIPVMFPLVFLYSPEMNSSSKRDTSNSWIRHCKLNRLEIFWYVCNIILSLFYGYVHQAGVIPLTSHVATELKAKPYLTHVHLYTSYTYSIPTALLRLRNSHKTYISSSKHKYRLAKDFHLYEQGAKDLEEVCHDIILKVQQLEDKHDVHKIPYRLYYALPITSIDSMQSCFTHNHSQLLNVRSVKTFYPHISIENPFYSIYNFSLQQFQLVLLRIEK